MMKVLCVFILLFANWDILAQYSGGNSTNLNSLSLEERICPSANTNIYKGGTSGVTAASNGSKCISNVNSNIYKGGVSSVRIEHYFNACELVNKTDISRYHLISRNINPSYVIISDNNLSFTFLEEYNGGILNYKIYDYKRKVIEGLEIITKMYGINFFHINLSKFNMVKGNIYVLEIISEKGEKSFLNFKILN